MYTFLMTTISSKPVLSVVEARSRLGQLIKQLADESTTSIYIGSHRKPSVVLLPADKAPLIAGAPRLPLVKAKAKFLELLMPQFEIKRIGIFGSVARNSDHVDSDIDFAVEADKSLELSKIVDLEMLLEELFQTKVQVTQLKSDSRFANSIANDLIWLT